MTGLLLALCLGLAPATGTTGTNESMTVTIGGDTYTVAAELPTLPVPTLIVIDFGATVETYVPGLGEVIVSDEPLSSI